jgi:prevent-host-death family protein
VDIAQRAAALSPTRIGDVAQRYDRILTAEATMIDTTPDVQPLTAFRENPAEFVQQLKTTHRPITLTVDGQPEVVIQEAAAYKRLFDLAAQAEEDEAIREGIADMQAGRTRPIDEVFDEMREKYAIPR